MSTTIEWLQFVNLLVAFCTGLGVPFIIAFIKRGDERRTEMRNSIDERLRFLDGAIDDLKTRVLSQACSRADVADLRAEINETITRVRSAITAEMTALNVRVTRVEDLFLHMKGDG